MDSKLPLVSECRGVRSQRKWSWKSREVGQSEEVDLVLLPASYFFFVVFFSSSSSFVHLLHSSLTRFFFLMLEAAVSSN